MCLLTCNASRLAGAAYGAAVCLAVPWAVVLVVPLTEAVVKLVQQRQACSSQWLLR